MATDYDAPRRDEVDLGEDSLEELKSPRVSTCRVRTSLTRS
jgi:hypothetical protein